MKNIVISYLLLSSIMAVAVTDVCDRGQIVQEIEDMTGKNCRDITAEDLAEITTLELYERDITELSDNAFAGMTSLKSLDLSDNRLTSFPASAIKGLENSLEELSLGGNKIKEMSESDLQGFSIKVLNLADNKLTKLPVKELQSISHSLEYLHVKGNPISRIADDALIGFDSLMSFSISKNTEFNKDKLFESQIGPNGELGELAEYKGRGLEEKYRSFFITRKKN